MSNTRPCLQWNQHIPYQFSLFIYSDFFMEQSDCTMERSDPLHAPYEKSSCTLCVPISNRWRSLQAEIGLKNKLKKYLNCSQKLSMSKSAAFHFIIQLPIRKQDLTKWCAGYGNKLFKTFSSLFWSSTYSPEGHLSRNSQLASNSLSMPALLPPQPCPSYNRVRATNS